MILILGQFRIDPSRLDEARPILQAMVDASRSESGCLAYHYSVDLADPSVIQVREAWRDDASFAAHAETDHLRHWREQWPRLGIYGRNLQRYTLSSVTDC